MSAVGPRLDHGDERGQTTLMIIGFAVIALLMVTVVVNASAAFLARRSLSSWADGAAVLAAQSVAEDAVYAGQVGEMLPLSQAAAREAVGGYVARQGLAGRFEGFRVAEVAVRGDGAVTVTLTARVPMAFVNTVAPGSSVPVVGSASALAPLR